MLRKNELLLILSHRKSPFPVNPGKQVQLIVLRGNELWTSHFAFLAQGFIAKQGFLHSLSKHASLLAHSLSSLHPGSGGGGTKININSGLRVCRGQWVIIKSSFRMKRKVMSNFLLGVQAIPYGSPVNPGRHLHIPLWFLGVQSAFWAQSQGSTHFSFLHVRVVEQSGSIRHSGFLHLS